jgi:hypothetical protein
VKRSCARATCGAILLALWFAVRVAAADAVEQLASDDRATVAAAVAEIERMPASPDAADALFRAARACEEKLADPPRALALYERILKELPDASVAMASERRAERLRVEVGRAGEHAEKARELAAVMAAADERPAAEIEQRVRALAEAAWPGAADAALWLAEWLRRTGRFAEAETQYDAVVARFPGTPQAALAARGAVGAAIDGHAWDRAESLARALPAIDAEDAVVRDELITAADRGRFRARLYTTSWIALVLALLALVASLTEAAVRGGRRRPALIPPVEVLFLVPAAAVLVAVSFTAHRAIAPAVLRISLVGIACAWLSGLTLDLLRRRGRAFRRRALAHILACLVATLSIGYIAVTRDNLMDLLAETVRFGPE